MLSGNVYLNIWSKADNMSQASLQQKRPVITKMYEKITVRIQHMNPMNMNDSDLN